jgi:hypothetical protein
VRDRDRDHRIDPFTIDDTNDAPPTVPASAVKPSRVRVSAACSAARRELASTTMDTTSLL